MTDDTRIAQRADDAVLDLVRGGATEAYEVLVQRHEQAARRLALCLVPAEDADSLADEAFGQIFDLVVDGGGPAGAFRPYLLTALRRISSGEAYPLDPGESGDLAQVPDLGEPLIEPAVAALAAAPVTQAFGSLPDRYMAVLWYAAVEDEDPAAVGEILDLYPGELMTLSHRAWEALRQAYVQLHARAGARPECEPTLRVLPALAGETAGSEDQAIAHEHLSRCDACTGVRAELDGIDAGTLRAVVAPVILGSAAEAYLPAGKEPAAAPAGLAGEISGPITGAWEPGLAPWEDAEDPARWDQAPATGDRAPWDSSEVPADWDHDQPSGELVPWDHDHDRAPWDHDPAATGQGRPPWEQGPDWEDDDSVAGMPRHVPQLPAAPASGLMRFATRPPVWIAGVIVAAACVVLALAMTRPGVAATAAHHHARAPQAAPSPAPGASGGVEPGPEPSAAPAATDSGPAPSQQPAAGGGAPAGGQMGSAHTPPPAPSPTARPRPVAPRPSPTPPPQPTQQPTTAAPSPDPSPTNGGNGGGGNGGGGGSGGGGEAPDTQAAGGESPQS